MVPSRVRRAVRLLAPFAVALGLAALFPTAASGASGSWPGSWPGSWTVKHASGTIETRSGPGGWAVLQIGAAVPAGNQVRTGADGWLTLVSGDISLALSPASAIEFGGAEGAAVMQRQGTLIYRIGSETGAAFVVATPDLTARARAATFTVAVDRHGGALHVVRGAVEMRSPFLAQVSLVRAGQTAIVPAAAPRRPAAPSPEGIGPKADAQPRGAVIQAPIGLARLDVFQATGGLVDGVEARAGLRRGRDGDVAATDQGEDTVLGVILGIPSGIHRVASMIANANRTTRTSVALAATPAAAKLGGGGGGKGSGGGR